MDPTLASHPLAPWNEPPGAEVFQRLLEHLGDFAELCLGRDLTDLENHCLIEAAADLHHHGYEPDDVPVIVAIRALVRHGVEIGRCQEVA
jgi:hypothetical protein